jgi:hypothetical protein
MSLDTSRGEYGGSELKSVYRVCSLVIRTRGPNGELQPPVTVHDMDAVKWCRLGADGYIEHRAGLRQAGSVEIITEIDEMKLNHLISHAGAAAPDYEVDEARRIVSAGPPKARPHPCACEIYESCPQCRREADPSPPAAPADSHVTPAEAHALVGDLLGREHSVPAGFAAKVTELVRERGSDYGSPAENHQLTADLWSAWLSRRMNQPVTFTAEDVCMFNILQKQSRLAFITKDDSWFDVAGYTENVAMLRKEQRNK